MSVAYNIRRACAPGHRIADRYVLQEPLGRGGTAVVWSARDDAEGVEVALKLIAAGASADEPSRRRFLREALAARSISHPNVVEVSAAGVDREAGAWLAMARYRGETLAERLDARTEPWSVDETAAVALPILDGLACAHEARVLHRDLKPGNIFLHTAGGAEVPKLLDFGGAKIASAEAITSTGLVIGTPHYISPEQASCTRDVDARADVWSAGVLLYRLLVGRVPFDGQNLGALLTRVFHALPESPAAQGVAPAVSSVILRCLEKDPRARYADARALKHDLCDALGLPRDAGSPAGSTITSARVAAPRALAATIRPTAMMLPSLRAALPANDTAPPRPTSEASLLVPPAPPTGSVPPEFFGTRITPLRAPPPDILRAARKMDRAQRAALVLVHEPANDVVAPPAEPPPAPAARPRPWLVRAALAAVFALAALAFAWLAPDLAP